MTTLHLYTGKDCHLCDLALGIIRQSQPQLLANLEKVDIKSDPALYHQYALSIPVLERMDTRQTLYWPFDATQLKAFLR